MVDVASVLVRPAVERQRRADWPARLPKPVSYRLVRDPSQNKIKGDDTQGIVLKVDL